MKRVWIRVVVMAVGLLVAWKLPQLLADKHGSTTLATSSPGTLAANLLAGSLRTHVKTTTRPLSMFNYSRKISPSGELRARVKAEISSIWPAFANLKQRPEYTNGSGTVSAGIPGFYLSLDPVASVAYGGEGTNWFMIEVRLAKGMRYLELGANELSDVGRTTFEATFDESVAKEIESEGCHERALSNIILTPPSAACAKIASDTLQLLNVDAVLYPFEAALTGVCQLQPQAAMLMLSDRKVGDVRGYSNNSGADASSATMLGILNRVYELADGRGAKALALSHKWNVKSPSDEQAKAWVNQNIFGCIESEMVSFDQLENMSTGE